MIRLKDIINEEVSTTLFKDIIKLYNEAGIKTKYTQKHIDKYGDKVVDGAIKMTPKILDLKKKMKSFANDVAGSEEGKLLIKLMYDKMFTGNSRDTLSAVGHTFIFLNNI